MNHRLHRAARRRHPAALATALAALACALLAGTPAQAQTPSNIPSGGVRVFREAGSINTQSPGYLARSFDSTVAPGSTAYTGAELNLAASGGGLKLDTSLLVLGSGDAKNRSKGRFNELYLTRKAGALQVGGGLRVVDWDVGYGFRPNDLVMMETTRPLSQTSRRGKYLLQVDHFGSSFTTSAVWVNPQRWGSRSTQVQSTRQVNQESAFAGQVYTKVRDLDLYGFGRYGQRTGSSAGAAVVGVPTDAITLQASTRLIRRHNALVATGLPEQFYSESPWALRSQRNAWLASVGGSWAGSAKQTLFLEYWYDARAPSNAQWNEWKQRGLWLRQSADAVASGALQVPARALAGNLAWQEVPMDGLNQRRDSVLLRLAWQPEDFALTFDTVVSPADGGSIYTLSAQWRSHGLTLNAAARWLGGPTDSVARQLPVGTTGLVSATWSF